MGLSREEEQEIDEQILDDEVDALPREWGCSFLIFLPLVSFVTFELLNHLS